jgi:hypothetical protein
MNSRIGEGRFCACAPGLGAWLEGGRRKAGDPKSSRD